MNCPFCGAPFPCLKHGSDGYSRRTRVRLAAVAAAGLLALAGCGGPAGPHGTVTGKTYKAARTTWRTVPKTKRVCITSTHPSGKPASTSRFCGPVPDGTRRVADYRPECWELELDTGDELCVSEDIWRTTRIGDRY